MRFLLVTIATKIHVPSCSRKPFRILSVQAHDARIFVQYCRQRHRVYVVTTSPIFSAPRATLAPATFHHSSERFSRYHYTHLPSLPPWLLHDIVLKLRCSSRPPQPADDRPWMMIPTVAHIIASKSYAPNKVRGRIYEQVCRSAFYDTIYVVTKYPTVRSVYSPLTV